MFFFSGGLNVSGITNPNYELLKQEQIPDIQSEGYLLRHKKSGAKICVLSNRDENKVFFIGFRTPPKDSTGVAHIIEHTVLCGSRKFPLKDPFIELVKGSMNTFLNAMTYPDKTLYPVASCNDKDFSNLMDVYMDSVFYPNIYQNENIFRQEGWHYELENAEDDLTINGVVYNEMKGAFSSPEGILEREIFRSLYPDTSYANESGGDPECIPDLTYEDYLDFHRTYYHPSNSYIYLYGDFDIEERLNWLDREYLSEFEQIRVDSEIGLQTPFEAPLQKQISYPVASNASLDQASYLAAAWSVGTNLDREQYIAFDLLEYALLNTQGAPLKQALLDAGIGNDIYGGYDSGSLQPVFTVIAKNTDADQKERFVSVIQKVLKEQVEKGLHKRTLEAALNASEFKFREADYGNIPKGLMLGIQVMDGWLYDENAPFLHLHELDVYDSLRKKLNTGYFEDLIRTCLLDNPHCLILTAAPDPELNRKKEAALEETLSDHKNALSVQEIDELIKKTEDVHAFGLTPSTPEELATIPHLTRADMKRDADPFSNILYEEGNVPVLAHDYETNGILYIDLQFAIDHLKEEMLPTLGILRRLLGKLDTKAYTYTDLTDEIYLHTGGIRPEISIYADVTDHDAYSARFELRIKVLKEKIAEAVKLVNSILCDTCFTDEKRIYELLAEGRSRLRSDLSEAGHSASVKRALSYQSPVSRYGDLTSGIAYYRFLEDLVDHFEDRKEKLLSDVKALYEDIFAADSLMVSCTCQKALHPIVLRAASEIADMLSVKGEREAAKIVPFDGKNEGFSDASQVQYVSIAGKYDIQKTPYQPAFRICRAIMSYEYLWNQVRVQGGAYGCMAGFSKTGDVYFTSYRDPNLKETLEVYRNVPAYLKSFTADEKEMTKYVIGTFSDLDTPLSPADKGRRSLGAYLTGLTYEDVQNERNAILNADIADIRNLADLIEEALDQAGICVIGNEDKLNGQRDLFDALIPLDKPGE